MKNLIDSHREYIVAIGEAGLDYHYLSETTETADMQVVSQKEWFISQWKLAEEYNLPLVIHTRDAREDTLKMIMENNIHRAVIHCYSEDPKFARTLMDFSDGIYFAFG